MMEKLGWKEHPLRIGDGRGGWEYRPAELG